MLTPLYDVVLDGKDVCLHLLLESLYEFVIIKKLLPTKHIQLDKLHQGEYKHICVCLLVLLVAEGILKEVFMSFILVGHMQNIDVFWANKHEVA